MIDRRFDVDDMFWIQDSPMIAEGRCFIARGECPKTTIATDGERRTIQLSNTQWELTTYGALQKKFGIDFSSLVPAYPDLLAVAWNSDGVSSTEVVRCDNGTS